MDPQTDMPKPQEHTESDESLRSEVVIEGSFLTLITIIQNLYTLGMNSVHSWGLCMDKLKKDDEIRKDPFAMNIVFNLTSLFHSLEQNLHSTAGPSQKHLTDLEHDVKQFDDIMRVLKPTLNKKPLKGLKYALDTSQKIMNYVNSIFKPKTNESKRSKKQKNTKHTKKTKRSASVFSISSTSSKSSSSSSSSSSSCSSDGSDFENLFDPPKKQSTVISQEMLLRNKNRRTKFCSPGEQGTHLIKIEITNTKDLKSVPISRFWDKSVKKGCFYSIRPNQKTRKFRMISQPFDTLLGRKLKILKIRKPKLMN